MSYLQNRWYQKSYRPNWLLRALEKFYCHQFKRAQRNKLKKQWRPPVPVVIVGNITVGGTGKTPLVAWLVQFLTESGYRPGIVSRGYKAKPPKLPWSVSANDKPEHAGDEPLMLTRRCGCPIVIDPNRRRAAKALIEQHGCDLIISDDGLQHVALGRDVEIVVVDGARGLGNGHCLPAGPLREPAKRLQSVDFVISNGESDNVNADAVMRLVPEIFCGFDGGKYPLDYYEGKVVNAVAGIGNPKRFFKTLDDLGCKVRPLSFPDHHNYSLKDLPPDIKTPLLTTEKDAVKLTSLPVKNGSWLKVSASLPATFETDLLMKLSEVEQTINRG